MDIDTVDGEPCYEMQLAPIIARRAAEDARWDATCPCGRNAGWNGVGRARRYCSDKCRVRAYRQRKRAARESGDRER